MIVTPAEMRALEESAFASGISAEKLMDEAGLRIAEAVQQFHPRAGDCLAVFGKGHNGGDALVAARHLSSAGWKVHLVPAFPKENWAALTRKKYEEAGLAAQLDPGIFPQVRRSDLVMLDGLLGTGASGELRDPIAACCRRINEYRREKGARVYALDLPTGLDGDTGRPATDCVTADVTLAIGFAKTGLVADAAINHVGRLAVLPLRDLEHRGATRGVVATPGSLAPLLPPRAYDSHKGHFGRIGIVAGSRGYVGAAVMCADACVRAGAGLVTLYVPEEIYPVAAGAAAPEVMVRPIRSFAELKETRRDVLALGPGLGQERKDEVLDLIASCQQPMIIDADGLNILATRPEILHRAAGPRLLTPHPGEMGRLAPHFGESSRREIVERWTAEYPGVLLLKGARTIVGERGRPLSFNTTGNPGMASGGMGDTLTGVLAALAGQGLAPYDAARLGAWLCGRAAEWAVAHGGDSEESLVASSVTAALGSAFRELRGDGY